MRHTAIALAALMALAAAPAAIAQTPTTKDKTYSAQPDHTAASSNYTGQGHSGAGGAAVDHGPAANTGSSNGQPTDYQQ